MTGLQWGDEMQVVEEHRWGERAGERAGQELKNYGKRANEADAGQVEGEQSVSTSVHGKDPRTPSSTVDIVFLPVGITDGLSRLIL